MTPSQAYAQWKQYAADPADSEAQSIQKFSQQFGIAPEQEEELYKAYPDQPKFRAPRKSGFLSQTFGAGVDELQKSLGSAIAGPGAETLADFGWEGGAGFLEDIGSDIVKQQEIDLQEYEAPQTREELIKEGGVLGSLYENVFSPVLQTPQQMGRQALPSLGAAGVALGAAGVAALASGGNPFIVGATAMAVGNAVGSFQVGGEEFETAKRDPFIRKQLGIDPNADFADLTPDQQRDLTDSAQRIAKETMVERLYQGGALESLAFIPYGPLALRYLADIGLGATSEEMDKRLGMENTIQELQRLGVSRAEIPELREKMKGLRPGTMETMLNAAVMEATFGSPTAIIETIAQPDSRVDQYLTAKKGKADKLKILDKNIEEAMADPIKLQKAENDLIEQDEKRATRRRKEAERLADRQKKLENEAEVDLFKQQQKLNEMTGQDDMGRTIESSEVNGFPDYIFSQAGMTTEQVDAAALKFAEEESARAEAWAKQETDRQFEAEGKKKKKKKTTSISKSAREEVVIEGEGVTNSLDAMDNVAEGTAIDSPESDPNQSFISIDKITQQVALNEYMAAFPEINFKGSTLVKDKDGVPQIIYEDENGDIQSDTDWELMEGFIDDEQIFGKKESPVVYLTQSMYDEGGHLITDTKAAIERMTEVAFHEAIGHAGLRNLLSAGKMLDVDPKRDEKGKITNKDYQRWEGEQYNRFIDGFRNRHRKMIDNWAKGDGKEYLKESEFRQTEEFIARNYGEAGGGKPIGFFDNAAILLREINPFIGNSLTQHQVAKQLQLVVDRYATGIKGKAPSKKNILSGAELVGTIARAATQAGLEEELKTETDIELTSPRREKAKAERKGLETLKAPKTTYEVMAPEQIQELQTDRTILEETRKKQTAAIKEEKEMLGKMAPALRKKIKEDKAAEAEAKVQTQKEQTSEDLRVVGKAKTSAEVLDGLAKTGTPQVRIEVAKHKNTSDETLAILAAEKDQPGVVGAAIRAINAREKKVSDAAERKTRDEERAVEKKALDETALAKARDVVEKLNAKLKDKGKLSKADFTRLVKKEERVKELKKTLGIKEPEVKAEPKGTKKVKAKKAAPKATKKPKAKPKVEAKAKGTNLSKKRSLRTMLKDKGSGAVYKYVGNKVKVPADLIFTEDIKKGIRLEKLNEQFPDGMTWNQVYDLESQLFNRKYKHDRSKGKELGEMQKEAEAKWMDGLIKLQESQTKRKTKSKRSLSRRGGGFLNPTPVEFAASHADTSVDEMTGEDIEPGSTQPDRISLQTIFFAGESIDRDAVPALLDRATYREGIVGTMQESEIFKLLRKKGETDDQFRRRFAKEVTKIRMKKAADLKVIKGKLDKLRAKSRDKWTKKQEQDYLALREEISKLTVADRITRKDAGKRKNLRAKPWEFFGLGLFMSQTDRSLSQLKPLPKPGKTQYSVSPEGVTDFDILEASIAIESLRSDLSNMMLSLKGDEELTPKGKRLYAEKKKVSEQIINDLESQRVEYQKDVAGAIQKALKILKPEKRRALELSFGLDKKYGAMEQAHVAEVMNDEGFKTTEGHNISQQWISKSNRDSLDILRGEKFKNAEVREKNFEGVSAWLFDVMGEYPKATGEKSKTSQALTKEVEADTLEKEKRWSKLHLGRVDYKSYQGNKEIKAERDEAAAAFWRDYGIVPRVGNKENIKKWGIPDEAVTWARENKWVMKRPPADLEVTSPDILGEPDPIAEEVKKGLDELMDAQFDTFYKNPELFEKAVKDMSPQYLEGLSEAWLKKADPEGKTKSKRTFIPNVPKDLKFNKLQRWVYALLGPTEKALDYTRKSLGRTAKKYQEASPKNSHSKYVLPNGNIFYIGKNKTTDNWIEQVESVLNDKEIMSAKRWYPTVKPAFEKAFGKEEAPKMMLAWALANKGESPLGAMKNILKVGQNLKKYLKAEYTKKGGLADANIIKVLKEELITSGAGVKLYDFVDAAIGMKYRSVAGFDALMGAPAVVDRHTWRDFGFIDNALLNHLKKALPDNKKLKSIKLDRQDPSVTDTEYELAANWLRKMTDDLNARNWKGRSDWKPNEVQAVGWMGITTALGDVGGTPAQVIAETSRTLAFEIDFGEGSPFSKLFGKDFNEVISPEEKERITYLVGDLVADIALKKTGMKQTERIRGYGYYEDGGANPNVILKVSGTDPAMADIMNVIGLLAQQTDVIAFGPKTGARGVGFDFRDKNNKLKNKDTQDKLYKGLREAFPNYVLGASQTTIKGKNGLRIVLDNAQAKKGKTVAETQQNVADLGRKIKREMWPVLKNLAQDLNLDLQLEMFQAETFYANNDWKENKNGERYIRGIDSRFRPSVSRRIVDNDTARIQRKIQTEIEKSKNKTAKAPEGEDLNVLETDVNPVFIRSVTTPNFRLQPVSKSRRSKPDISRSRHAAGADQRFGSRWTNFWLGQISKIRPLSKLSPESKEAYIKLRQVAFGQLAQWEHFSSSVYKALVDSKQSKEIYKYLTTPNANSSIISDPNERIHAEKAKRAIDKIGETLVSKKLMKETTLRDFKKKHGDYLPRVYLRHLLDENDRTAIARGLKPSNLEYLKQRRDIPKGVRELILGELTDQPGAPALLASRALMVPGKDLAIMNWMQKMKDLSIDKNLGWVIPNQFVSFNTLEEARAITKDLKISDAVMKKLELDVDFSDMSTEVTPAWLAAESAKLKIMAMDLQGDTKKIVTELYRRMSERAADMEPMFGEGVKIEGFTKLPNSARYGAMRGMWMHKQIADDIIGGMKMATGDESNWEKLVGETGKMGQYNAYWKWAKVAGNPPSWARNYISNNILLTLAGIPFWSIPGLNIAAAKEMLNKGKYYQIALKQGVMSGNMSHAELGKLETDFKRIQRKMQEDKNPLLWLQGGIGAVMEKTSNIYGGIETLGKIGAIKYAMEKKGMNESEAAAFANKWLFDYGLVTPSVRYASTAVVGAPFIRFQSHAIPLMLEVALTKPWRFLPYYALGYGMVELFKNNHDLDEEDFKAIKLALPEWLQEKAITPSIGSIPLLPPNILPLPSKDAQGRWVIHDVSYLMPWGMMSEVAGEVSKGRFGDAMKSLGLMGGPLADALVVLKTGVDPFTRRPITDDTKDWTSQAADYIKYMMNMSTPSMFHSSHGAAVRAYDSIVGNLDPKTGELKYEPWQALPRLFGQNLYATNLVEQRRTNMRRMKWEMGNLKAAWKRQLRGLMRSKAPREEIQEARDEYMELLKEKQEEMGTYIKKSRVPASLRAG